MEAFHPVVDRIDAGRMNEGPGYRTWRRHGTSDWLIIDTVAGRGRFGRADGGDVLAETGDVMLLRPGVFHDYGTAFDADRWEIVYAHFHPRSEWMGLLDWPDLGDGVLRVRAAGVLQERIAAALDRAGVADRSGLPLATLFALNALEEALLWCARLGAGRGAGLDPRLLVVTEHVAAHLAEPLTVAGLARVVAVSPSRLAHLFTAQLGLPPMRYLEQQRMQAARQLLDLTDRSVAQVAAAVGFTDPLYFSARFRRATGQPPSAYRHRRSGDQTPQPPKAE